MRANANTRAGAQGDVLEIDIVRPGYRYGKAVVGIVTNDDAATGSKDIEVPASA